MQRTALLLLLLAGAVGASVHPLRRDEPGAVAQSFDICGQDVVQPARGRINMLRAKLGFALHQQAKPKNGHICIEGKQVPQLYLLGVQKAGTTSMADDLITAGAHSAIKKKKELHTFDRVCNFLPDNHRNAAQLRGEVSAGECELSDDTRLEWLGNFEDCTESGAALTDMTPSYVRVPGLPKMLSKWYQPYLKNAGPNLGFIVNLREPLQRMQSGFYQRLEQTPIDLDPMDPSFASYVLVVLEKGAHAIRSGNVSAFSRNYVLDSFYRSLYAMNLRPWFATFLPEQFAIVTMKPYFGSLQQRRSIIGQLLTHFQIQGRPCDLEDEGYLNRKPHPTVEQELTQDAIDALNRKFFHPDARNLSSLLSKGWQKGLLLPGYEGPGGPDSVFDFLQKNW